MKARVLIIEDEKEIGDLISLYLKKEGMETVWCETGEEGLSKLEHESFDLVALDINLPGIDGFETLQRIRKFSEVSVVIISAREEDVDMLLGFGGGADDYVTKPFSPSVLAARIRAHLKRKNEGDNHSEIERVSFGPLTLNFYDKTVHKEGQLISLPPRETDLLFYLAESPGKAHTQEEIFKKVWGNEYGEITTVSVHIQRLRKKLEDDPSNPLIIKTRYGAGYYMEGHS